MQNAFGVKVFGVNRVWCKMGFPQKLLGVTGFWCKRVSGVKGVWCKSCLV